LAGEDIPEFPERYQTGAVVGRVDLLDIIPYDEYVDTIPKELQEQTTAAYLFVVRNPCTLDIPIRMGG
jgi:hypothetical protein